jgi:hypothetical protein
VGPGDRRRLSLGREAVLKRTPSATDRISLRSALLGKAAEVFTNPHLGVNEIGDPKSAYRIHSVVDLSQPTRALLRLFF